MSSDLTTQTGPTEDLPDDRLSAAASTAPIEGGLGDYARNWLQRVRGGDMGSLPATTGLVVLVIIFAIAQPVFFSYGNFANLITQAAPTILLAMGLVFVLLLGEIDLSAGTAAGVCAAVMAKLMLSQNSPWWLAVLAATVTGAVIGLFIGWARAKVRIPSFVVTLALFLAFQGVVLWVVGNSGNISIQSDVINAIENTNMPVWMGWAMTVLFLVIYAGVRFLEAASRRRHGVAAEPPAVMLSKLAVVVVLSVAAVWALSQNRALATAVQVVNGKIVHITLQGVPWVVPFVVVLLAIWSFVLGRTRYGRHVYAVGGNEEAARRAGIAVDRVRISVFVICSFMASLAGIALASELSSVDPNEGAGNTLLLAVGAAVIGGTSLFGGKGRALDAVIGGAVVAVIANGMADLIHGNNSQAVQEIVTGIVLMVAAAVDALSRRRAGASGLG